MATTTQTPPLIVSRQVSACALCRRKKTKCDGGLPACSSCVTNDKAAECSNGNEQFARGRERSYVTALETQIEKLRRERDRLRTHSPTRASRTPEPSNTAAGAYLSPPPTGPREARRSPSAERQQRGPRPTETSDVDDLVSDFGYLAVSATASGYQGFVREMSFARLLFSTATVEPLPPMIATAPPPRELAVSLVDECQRRVLQFTPVLSSTSIFRSLDLAYQRGGRGSSPLDTWNLRMVLALGCLCRSQTRGDVHYQSAVAHAAAALEHREAVIQPGSVASLQAMLLLALYSLMDPTHFKAWYVIGVAARVAVDMGLHTDLGTDPHMPAAQRDFRRRVFYCVYMLDRAITMTLVRAVSFTDASVDVELPAPRSTAPDAPWSAPGPAGPRDPSLDLIRARKAQAEHYQRVFLGPRAALHRRWHQRAVALNQLGAQLTPLIEAAGPGPQSIGPALRAELHFCSLLLLLPPGGEQALGPYGEVLAFDHAAGFAAATWHAADAVQARDGPCCTALDLDRSLRVSRWLLDLLAAGYCAALSCATPTPPAPEESAAGAPLPPVATADLAQRRQAAVTALQQLDEAVGVLGRRFGFAPQSPAAAPNGHAAVPSTGRVVAAHLDHRAIRAESAATLERLLMQAP